MVISLLFWRKGKGMICTKKAKRTKTIREAIDSYPGGICFATLDGMPILVNQQMNRLTGGMVGHTIIDALKMWEDLKYGELKNDTKRLEISWFTKGTRDKGEIEQIFIRYKGAIWQMEKQILTTLHPNVIQLSGVEVTKLYQLSLELYENNQKLREMQERQRELLDNIVQINKEKEILETKVKIHDELGRCIVATRKSLSGHSQPQDQEELYAGWKDTLRDLSNISRGNHDTERSAGEELLRVAKMVGCQIQFAGELPPNTRCQLLIFMAVREALTNAVRHGKADLLMVQITENEKEYRVEITNNGAVPVEPIQEGVGLSGLRRRLEQEGVLLKIESFPEVALILKIHKEKITGGRKR